MVFLTLITGAAGQDGRIAARILSNLGHRVFGIVKDENGLSKIRDSEDFHKVIISNVTNDRKLLEVIQENPPNFVMHFAGSSSVADSWEKPADAIISNVVGTLNLLEAVRQVAPQTRIVVSLSSEMYARSRVAIGSRSPTEPSSPYGIAKASSLDLVRLYREVHGMNCFGSILFNHESPLRAQNFVTKRIAMQVAGIKLGKESTIRLANPEVSKDFSWAPDVVRAIITHLTDGNDDAVFGSGELTSISNLVEYACLSDGLIAPRIEVERGLTRLNDSSHPFAVSGLNLNCWNREPKHPSDWMPLMVAAEIEEKSDPLWFVDA